MLRALGKAFPSQARLMRMVRHIVGQTGHAALAPHTTTVQHASLRVPTHVSAHSRSLSRLMCTAAKNSVKDGAATTQEGADGAQASNSTSKAHTRKRRAKSLSTASTAAAAPAAVLQGSLPADAVITKASLLDNLPPRDSPLWTKDTWVMFSDLHVQERTLSTCLQVLQRVREEALARGAGVLFLGDWWETRGTLPVQPLNAVLDELATWTEAGIPMLMLVGNHDEVDLNGEVHALEPLAAISRHFHCFSRPALFRGALWLPYRRQGHQLRQAIAAAQDANGEGSPSQPPALSCVFAHADVQTAKMNYRTQARDGLPPSLFKDLQVYSGHYHMPHTVPGTSIIYVGSQYQVGRGEAGENKRLLVLDATRGWSIQEEIPLDIGPRFYKCFGRSAAPPQPAESSLSSSALLAESSPNTTDTFLMDLEAARSGDLVKWVLRPEEYDDPEVIRRLEALKARGVIVEQAMAPSAQRGPRLVINEELTPHQVLDKYAASVEMSEEGLAETRAALQLALDNQTCSTALHVDLELSECELEGYGPFMELQVYPLSGRGLRVVTGDNHDDSGSSSNGAGKSSLMTAPLWALTGGTLARTETGSERSPVASMLNDNSAQARVALRGMVSGLSFEVERVVKRARGAAKAKTAKLSLFLDGKDMTQQDVPSTQAKINDTFNCGLAQSAVFFGQNDITNLLEANDAKFKEELGKVADIEVWPKARNIVKDWRSSTKQEASRAAGMQDLHTEQLAERQQQELQKREEMRVWEEQHQMRMDKIQEALQAIRSKAATLVHSLDQEEACVKSVIAALEQHQASLEQQVNEQRARLGQELTAAAPPPSQKSLTTAAAAAAAPDTPMQAATPQSAPSTLTASLSNSAETAVPADAASALFHQQSPAHSDTVPGSGTQPASQAAAGLNDHDSTQHTLALEASAEGSRSDQPAEPANEAAEASAGSAGPGPASAVPPQESRPEPALLSASLKEALDTNATVLPSLHRARENAERVLGASQRACGKAESRLSSAKEALMEWVGGLMNGNKQPSPGSNSNKSKGSKTVAQPEEADSAAQALASALLDSSPTSTKAWLASVSGLQPVCDKCGQHVDMDHFEQRIDDMKADIRRAQEHFDAAQHKQDAAQAELDAADTELMQKTDVIELCRQRYEEQVKLELQERRAAMEAERAAAEKKHREERKALEAERKAAAAAQKEQQKALEAERAAIKAKQKEERKALEAERAAFEAQQRAHKEAMALCRKLEQQHQEGQAALDQGSEVLKALSALRIRVPLNLPDLELQQGPPSAVGSTSTKASTIQEALSQVHAASKSALKAIAEVDSLCRQLEQLGVDLKLTQQEVKPHAGQLELLQQQVALSEQALHKVTAQLAELEQRQAALEEAHKALGGGGVQSFVLEGVLGNLQMLTGTYMQQLANNMVLELSATKPKATSKGDGEESIERIDKVIKYRPPGGEERVRLMQQLSGGERRRVALALCLAYADLVRQYGRLTCNVLVLDEVLQQLDEEGCIRVADMLRELPLSSVFVVGQASSFVTQAFEKMDTVVKKGGYSRISITP